MRVCQMRTRKKPLCKKNRRYNTCANAQCRTNAQLNTQTQKKQHNNARQYYLRNEHAACLKDYIFSCHWFSLEQSFIVGGVYKRCAKGATLLYNFASSSACENDREIHGTKHDKPTQTE